MSDSKINYKGEGQASRLSEQHESSGGQLGIFGKNAQNHDFKMGSVTKEILGFLKDKYLKYDFRIRNSLNKTEINKTLSKIDSRLGKTIFVANSRIKPDGGILEIKDNKDSWRVLLVGESKHQGNDVEKISKGVKQGKNKDQDFMAAGNAIERVHKNINEFKNYLIAEKYFSYIVFFQGSNFAIESFDIETPSGKLIRLDHDSGLLNRIDRVTASNYSMEINKVYCRNIALNIGNTLKVIQIPSLFFQCNPWSFIDMYETMLTLAEESIAILKEENQI